MGQPKLKVVWDRDLWIDRCDERAGMQFACTNWQADISIWQDIQEENVATAIGHFFYQMARCKRGKIWRAGKPRAKRKPAKKAAARRAAKAAGGTR